jgi:hypothetical protein
MMKIASGKPQAFAYFIVTFLICFSLCGQAAAEWHCIQGSSGQLWDATQQNTAVEPKLYYAWGIGYQQKPNATNWIMFPVPSIGLASLQYIVLNLNGVLGGDIYVDRVAVWSGETKLVDDIVVNWTGDAIGWQRLDLGAPYMVSSLSISLRTRTGDFGGMMKVYTLCADLTL